MPSADQTPTETSLESPDAGRRAIRGGAVRVLGYGAGLLLTAIASIFLLRHLGVVRFGQYTTVVAIVTVVQGVTEGGLMVVGQRLLVAADEARRRTLMADLVGMRIVVTPLGVVAGVGFAALAGYPDAIVVGTVLAGAGVVLAVLAGTLTLPLTVDLRLGAVTAVDFARQLVIVVGIVGLVAAGAGLVAFFGIYVAAGAVAVAAALALSGSGAWVAPRFAWAEWRPVLVEAVPVALSAIVNTTYVRSLMILASLLTTAEQTGLFAASFRVSEILLGVPQMMLGAAFPILAHAHASDPARLRYALQRLGEAALLLGLGLGLVLVVAAEPIVDLLGGSDFGEAADPLRIQSVAIAGAFMTQLGTFALIAVRRQRELVFVNVFALVSVLVLGGVLIPLWGANGAALAASVGEVGLAVAALVMLSRVRPDLRPRLGYVPKLLAAAALGGACVLLPLPDLAQAACAAAVYAGTALALRAVPLELVEAVLQRRSEPPGPRA